MKINIISTKKIRFSSVDQETTREEVLQKNNIIAVNDIAEYLGRFYNDEEEGLNILNDYSLICNHKEINDIHLKDLSTKIGKIIALPPETELIIEDGAYSTIENRPFYIFANGNKISFNKNIVRLYSYMDIKTPQSLLNFIYNNIEYGWMDTNNRIHLNNLENFKKDYKTMNTNSVLREGVGTSLEQIALIKRFFDEHIIKNKIYYYHKNDKKKNNKVELDIALFYRVEDIWYCIQVTGPLSGITKLNDIKEGIELMMNAYGKNNSGKITEIKEIPVGLTFSEFNKYVNEFKSVNLKNIE